MQQSTLAQTQHTQAQRGREAYHRLHLNKVSSGATAAAQPLVMLGCMQVKQSLETQLDKANRAERQRRQQALSKRPTKLIEVRSALLRRPATFHWMSM